MTTAPRLYHVLHEQTGREFLCTSREELVHSLVKLMSEHAPKQEDFSVRVEEAGVKGVWTITRKMEEDITFAA